MKSYLIEILGVAGIFLILRMLGTSCLGQGQRLCNIHYSANYTANMHTIVLQNQQAFKLKCLNFFQSVFVAENIRTQCINKAYIKVVSNKNDFQLSLKEGYQKLYVKRKNAQKLVQNLKDNQYTNSFTLFTSKAIKIEGGIKNEMIILKEYQAQQKTDKINQQINKVKLNANQKNNKNQYTTKQLQDKLNAKKDQKSNSQHKIKQIEKLSNEKEGPKPQINNIPNEQPIENKNPNPQTRNNILNPQINIIPNQHQPNKNENENLQISNKLNDHQLQGKKNHYVQIKNIFNEQIHEENPQQFQQYQKPFEKINEKVKIQEIQQEKGIKNQALQMMQDINKQQNIIAQSNQIIEQNNDENSNQDIRNKRSIQVELKQQIFKEPNQDKNELTKNETKQKIEKTTKNRERGPIDQQNKKNHKKLPENEIDSTQLSNNSTNNNYDV